MDVLTALANHQGLGFKDIVELETTGLAHKHYRLGNTNRLARVPIHSQHNHAPEDNLAYQAACFERVSASGHGPKLYDKISVSETLPMGALIVEEIEGRHARLPNDLPQIAACLANIHNSPVSLSPPLAHHQDPVQGMLPEIEAQAAFLSPETHKTLKDELSWARSFTGQNQPEPTCLVCTDTHPGNFLINRDGKAIIVDLEKALYGSPSVDLAHLSVYTSTTWDLNASAVLSIEDVQSFYQGYLNTSHKAELIKPWLIPMRRLLSLRALTWCAMWLSQHKSAQSGWSKDHVPDTLTQHVHERVNHFLEPATIQMNLNQTLALNL